MNGPVIMKEDTAGGKFPELWITSQYGSTQTSLEMRRAFLIFFLLL